jgi:hypothetical protein
MIHSSRWLVLGLLLFVPGLVRAQELKWRTDYASALQEAKTKGLPLLLEFTRPGDEACLRMEQGALRDGAVERTLGVHFVPLRIDAPQYEALVKAMQIQVYPTVVIASPAGRILDTHKGALEAAGLMDFLGKSMPKLGPTVLETNKPPVQPKRETQGTPVSRQFAPLKPEKPEAAPPGAADVSLEAAFREATAAAERSDFPRAVALLRVVLKDGRRLPIQEKAEGLLREIERRAENELARARELEGKGEIPEALQTAQNVARRYQGTVAAGMAVSLENTLSVQINAKDRERLDTARLLLTMAREEFRTHQYLLCLLRCEEIVGRYADLPQAGEANTMATTLRNNAAAMQKVCDTMPDVMGGVYLSVAENKIRAGEPQQAIYYLERIIQAFPDSRHAETAQSRLAQIQGPPAIGSEKSPE